jgi:hypothetical protein
MRVPSAIPGHDGGGMGCIHTSTSTGEHRHTGAELMLTPWMEDWIIYIIMFIALGWFLVLLIGYYQDPRNWEDNGPEWHPGDPEPW